MTDYFGTDEDDLIDASQLDPEIKNMFLSTPTLPLQTLQLAI